nr:MAG TPA: hypothetical protein [Caudoviricetes sp.]
MLRSNYSHLFSHVFIDNQSFLAYDMGVEAN